MHDSRTLIWSRGGGASTSVVYFNIGKRKSIKNRMIDTISVVFVNETGDTSVTTFVPIL